MIFLAQPAAADIVAGVPASEMLPSRPCPLCRYGGIERGSAGMASRGGGDVAKCVTRNDEQRGRYFALALAGAARRREASSAARAYLLGVFPSCAICIIFTIR